MQSVNHFTPKEKCSVKYRDVDYAVRSYLQLTESAQAKEGIKSEFRHESRHQLQRKWRDKFGPDRKIKSKHKTVYARKTDLKSAFRLLGLSKKSWPWVIMKACDPETGIWKFFVDKCLPFRASISCSHFQRFSDALCYLIENRTRAHKCVTNYLDDFLFIALTIIRCNYLIQEFLNLCGNLNIPVSSEKMEWGAELMVFLGILLDGRNLTLAIPTEKRDKVIKLLQEMIDRKKATVKELQVLCGFLNFICKAVFPRRTFTRRVYSKFRRFIKFGAGHKFDSFQMQISKLKQHHHVHLDKEFKTDCKVWLTFLSGNLASVVNRPMIDILGQVDTSKDICFFSDASAAKTLGFGAILNREWIYGMWPEGFIENQKLSIKFLELFTLCAGVLTWCEEPDLTNCRVTLFCDNVAMVHMINNLSSSCHHCMHLLRILVLDGLQRKRST